MKNLERLGAASLMFVALTDVIIFTVSLGNC